MTRSSRYLRFDGLFESGVLGTFRIIRGFASLKDLAEISVPYDMEDVGNGPRVAGQQRKIDPVHAEGIKRYLESGGRRFLPEVILSVRTELNDKIVNQFLVGVESVDRTVGISITPRWKRPNIRVHRMVIDKRKLNDIRDNKLIRRVDGNHRLELANTLTDDPALPTKYLAPFCIVLLGSAGETADDYSESLIFHTINSKALPLESEHALKLILGQHPEYDMTPADEFAFSPDLHFTRLLRDGLLRLPGPAQTRLGNQPLTSLHSAVRGLLKMDLSVAEDLPTLEQFGDTLLAALDDIVTRMEPGHPLLCEAEFFIELAARVWKATPDSDPHNDRVNATISYLEQLDGWLGNVGLVNLKESQSMSEQVIDIYNVVRTRIPTKVFLARWYPTASDGDELRKADLRLGQIQRSLAELKTEDGVHLRLVDMGTQTGGTFPIHATMYDEISSADIIIIDLTGVRPNVCVEAGYALRNHGKNLIFIFQPNGTNNEVPFDLNTFRYERFNDSGEIPEKIKPQIREILRIAKEGN